MKFARRSQHGEEVHFYGDEKCLRSGMAPDKKQLRRIRNLTALMMSEDGWTPEEAAIQLGILKEQVRVVVRDLVIQNGGEKTNWDNRRRPPRHGKELDQARKRIIKKLIIAGITKEEVLAIFPISENKVTRIIDEI
jgi:uncharacterized protein (DUF433 family)